jgi:long-chain acyl-CoA synthetase
MGSEISRSIVDRFFVATRNGGPRVAFRWRGIAGTSHTERAWESMTWKGYEDQVMLLASRFIEWGIEPRDRVAIFSENRWEWHVADLATLVVGAVSVPIYPTSSGAQAAYILKDSQARICIVAGSERATKIAAVEDSLTRLEQVLMIDATSASLRRMAVAHWPEWLAPSHGQGELSPQRDTVNRRISAIAPEDFATIVYTSGTTGPPKGVMLTHANISATVDMTCAVVPLDTSDRFLSFLPLSHIAERMVSHFGHIVSGGETWFARSFSTVAEDIVDCRPTVFFAVPRVWEKVSDSIQIEEHRLRGIRRFLYRRFQRVNRDAVRQPGKQRRLERQVLNQLVGEKIKKKLGLDQARAMLSGAAAIDPELLRWLASIDLRVGEVYGQTEVCGPTSVSPPHSILIGSVGQLLPGMSVRIASDGELLVKGPNVCAGYYNNSAATAELFDDQGWMRTGDLGRLDAGGYLYITGRKKDLMKTSQGKYIAPQEIETRLRSLRFVANAVVIAEARPFVSVLLTLDSEAVGPWADHRGKPLSLEALAVDPDVVAEVEQGIFELNQTLSPPEQIKRWRILPRDFTVDLGELTPTLKVVRTVVVGHFVEDINEMYAASKVAEVRAV